MRKEFLLWLLILTNIYSPISASDGGWNWCSWKVLVPAAIVAGTSASGIGLYHYIKKKAGIEYKEWHDVKLAFLHFCGMKIGEYTLLKKRDVSENFLDKIPFIRNRSFEKAAITLGISTGKKANKWVVFKIHYDGFRNDRAKLREREYHLNRPKG